MSWLTDKSDERNKYVRSLSTITLPGGKVMPAHGVRGADRADWYRLNEYDQATLKGQLERAKREAEPMKSETELSLERLSQRIEDEKLSKMTFRESLLYKREKELRAQLEVEKRVERVKGSDGWNQLHTSLENAKQAALQVGSELAGVFAAIANAINDDKDLSDESLSWYQNYFDGRFGELRREIDDNRAEKLRSINAIKLQGQNELLAEQERYDKLQDQLRKVKSNEPPTEPPAEPLPTP